MAQWFDWLHSWIHLPIKDPTWIFFWVLLVILFAPVVLERLKIPHIIGMILAGMLIGEHGFNILMRDSSFQLFGKVGLYYIMFLAGLEMNMQDFKNIRVKASVLGVLAFLIPFGIGIWVNLNVLHYGFLTAILLASMYASYTLISYPIVLRYGVNRQQAVGIVVGGTAITDTLTLLVLAMVSGTFKGEMNDLFLVIMLVKVVILTGLIVFFFPRIGRWFFRRYSDNVVQYIFVMAMMFLGAGLMQVVGMEGILGAFMSGLVFNRLIPHVSPLKSHLEFVGNALFIPYFLIGVGMLINMRLIVNDVNTIGVAAVMITVALTGKWLAVFITQKLFRMTALERRLMFGLNSSQAAATLAAVLVGYSIILPSGERLLNDDVLNGTVLLILVTCIVSSLFTDRAAKRMAMSDGAIAQSPDEAKERLLIPVANPNTIAHLMELGFVLRNDKRGDELTALNIVLDGNESSQSQRLGKRCLEKAKQIAASVDAPLKTVSRYDLNIATGIIHTARESESTSIIIGLHHKASIVDSFFGTLTENLLKNTNQQVMISRFLMPVNTLRRINVAVPPKAEFEHGFMKWITHMCRMSSTLGCRLHFYGQQQTLGYIKGYINKKHKSVLTQYQELESWDDLLLITGQVNYDHLLVIVSARRGGISYDSSFEKLPAQISKYFNNCSVMLLYPDMKGDPNEKLTFADPRGMAETRYYDKIESWLYKYFKSKK